MYVCKGEAKYAEGRLLCGGSRWTDEVLALSLAIIRYSSGKR